MDRKSKIFTRQRLHFGADPNIRRVGSKDVFEYNKGDQLMVPQVIEEYVEKVTNKRSHPETRQFYYKTLRDIQAMVSKAIGEYEKETAKK